MQKGLILSVVACVLSLFCDRARAELIYATNGTSISRFDSGTPGVVTTVAMSGLQTSETLTGIDVRPASPGTLYGVGSTSRLYTINPLSGVANQVGTSGAFTLNGTAFGTDFNPVPDRLRLVSNTEQNLRLNPNDGTLTSADSALNPAGNIVGIAYSNNFPGATTTILYGIDSVAGTLGNITVPNSGGPITTVGSLGLGTNLNENIGFDISGSSGIAFASITTSGLSRLYSINLTTGAATLQGSIGTGATPYLGLAAASAPEPASIGLLTVAGFFAGTRRLRTRSRP